MKANLDFLVLLKILLIYRATYLSRDDRQGLYIYRNLHLYKHLGSVP